MKLTDKIHLLKLDFEIVMSPEKRLQRFVNSILIFGEKITIIDTGVKGSEEKIFNYIGQNKRHYSEIGTIIISHSHPDHIGSAARIKDLTGCKVLAHEGETDWIEDINKQNSERPVPGFFNLVDRSVEVDAKISDGQILKADENISLKAIHSPGHSKGSLNILFIEDKILFTADSIPLKNDIPNYDNYDDLLKSLEKIKDNQDYNLLLTSWTPPLTTSEDIRKILSEGMDYILKLDNAVKESYQGVEKEPFEFCSAVLKKIGLPPFLTAPVVDRAFRSHSI